MKKFFQEFKTFAMRGNVMDMAVGIIIGGAFGKIVSSLVSDIILPVVGILINGINFNELKVTLKQAGEGATAVTINYGIFIQMVLDFVIVSFCIFMMIKAINKLGRKKEETPAALPEPSAEERLLSEIKDILTDIKQK
jgi:large conductance mechanosensitive channel